MLAPRPLPRHHKLGLAGGAEQVIGQGLAVSQLLIAEDVMRLLRPGGPELRKVLVTPRCAGMSPPPKIDTINNWVLSMF